MLQRRKIFEELLYDSFFFVMFYSVFSFILVASSGKAEYLFLFMLTYIGSVLTYIVRKKAKNFWVFMILNFLIILSATLIEVSKRTLVAMTIAMVIYSIRRRIKTESKYINMGTLLIFLICLFIMYLSADFFRVPFLRGAYFVEAILLILIVMLHKNVLSTNNELEFAVANSLQPIGEMLRFNNIVLTVYAAVAIVVMTSFKMRFLVWLLYYLGNKIIAALRWLILYIDSGEKEIVEMKMGGLGMPLTPMVGNASQSPVMEYIEQFLIYAVNIAVGLVLIAGAVAVFVYMYKRFNKKGEGIIEREDISADIKRESVLRKLFINNGPKNAIRRKFYNTVNKHYKKGVIEKCETPEEIKNKLLNIEDIDIQSYERERYNK